MLDVSLVKGGRLALTLFLFGQPVVLAQFAGSESCKACHAAQWEKQAKSGHAKALARGESTWYFGAGVQAVTPVSKVDDQFYLEHGKSEYRGVNAKTPGHVNTDGVKYRIIDPGSQIMKCFQCHSTGPLQLTADFAIQPKELGVKCESCHGPGAEHIERGGAKTAIFNPGQLNGSAMNDYCGNCHRKPGEDTDWREAWNVRHQPIYLNQSKCFQKSGGALTCISCHKPHESLARSGYDSICAGCHSKPSHKTVTVAGKTCVGCHMPVVKPQPNLGFTNHWIGVYRKGPLRP